MKEDVLEQVVDDYLKFKGYFTTHSGEGEEPPPCRCFGDERRIASSISTASTAGR
jgi:hypothetical protein